jgi:hypothetical protein
LLLWVFSLTLPSIFLLLVAVCAQVVDRPSIIIVNLAFTLKDHSFYDLISPLDGIILTGFFAQKISMLIISVDKTKIDLILFLAHQDITHQSV